MPKVSEMSNGGVQHTISQNMVPCHIDYFRLKQFEKTAEAGSSLHHPLPLKQIIKPSCERCFPYPQKKRASLSPRQRDTEKKPSKQAFIPLTSYSNLSYSDDCPLFIKSNIKILRFNCFFGSSFLYEVSHVV